MNNRFSEASTELLRCISCLDLRNHFSKFNVPQIMHLTTLYPEDFSESDCLLLPQQLSNFITTSEFLMLAPWEVLLEKWLKPIRNWFIVLLN